MGLTVARWLHCGLVCNRNIFERDPLEYTGIAQALHGIDLEAHQMSVGIVVGGYAFAKMLGCDRCLFEADVQRIHLLVVGDPHVGHP